MRDSNWMAHQMDNKRTSFSPLITTIRHRVKLILKPANLVPPKIRIPILPQELVDLILDALCADKATLRTCGLVSRAWVHTTRNHIFRQLDIQGRKQNASFAQFIELLDSPFCTFAQYVRCLSISGSYCDNPSNTWVTKNLPTVVSRLPRLKTFWCSSLHTSIVLPLKALTPQVDFTQRITTLRLQAVTFNRFEDIFHTICLFPNLHTLEWRSWYRMSREEEARLATRSWATIGRVPSTLRVVDVASHLPCNWSIWKWFLDCGAYWIHTIKIKYIDRPQVASLAEYLHRLGQGLDHLQLTLGANEQLWYFINSIDLRHNKSLRSLELQSSRAFAFAKSAVSLDLGMFPELLQRIPESLRLLNCILTNEHEVYCQMDKIEALDRLFQHPRLSHLESVRFCYEGRPLDERGAVLDNFAQKGVVSVVYRP